MPNLAQSNTTCDSAAMVSDVGSEALIDKERIHNPLSSNLVLVNHSLFALEQREGDPCFTHCVGISPESLNDKGEDYVFFTEQEYIESLAEHEARANIGSIADFWTTKECHTVLGIINNLVYHLGCSCGAVSRNEDGKLTVDRSQLLAIIKRDLRLVTALCHTKEYLEQYWPDAFHGLNRIREMIYILEDAGLLAYESHRSKGKVSRVYTFLDVPALLMLAEILEDRIGYESLPQHGAGLLQKMFNALFKGWGYRRKGVDGQAAPDSYDLSDAERKDTALNWRGWVQGAYDSAVNGYRAIAQAFGEHDSLAQSAFDEVKRLARLGRINQRKTGPSSYEFVGLGVY